MLLPSHGAHTYCCWSKTPCRPSKPLTCLAALPLGSQCLIGIGGPSFWTWKACFNLQFELSSFFSRLSSFQSPNFFFRAFSQPGLWVFPARPQQVETSSQLDPRHKSLSKSLPCTFRLLFQDHADLHQALFHKCISTVLARKQSFCGPKRKDDKASLWSTLIRSCVIWCLISGPSPNSPAGNWVSGQRGLDAAPPTRVNLCSDTLTYYPQVLEIWGKKSVFWGWLVTMHFQFLKSFTKKILLTEPDNMTTL